MIEVSKDELIELVDWMVIVCEECQGPHPNSTCGECPVDKWKDKIYGDR